VPTKNKSIGEMRRASFEFRGGKTDKEYMDKAVRDTIGLLNAGNEGDKKGRAFIANLASMNEKLMKPIKKKK